MYDDKGGRAMDRETHVRSHPIRANILVLHEEDKGRPLTAAALLRDLKATQATAAAVDYHVRVLRDAGLLPRADD